MKIGLLTSSRADFGIYYPLAKVIQEDVFFSLEVIAFGTHLKEEYGATYQEIENLGFDVKYKIDTPTANETAQAIAANIGESVKLFADFWGQYSFDLVFALGDRYEMFAAVSAGLPFNVNFAHIHGGETTLGAIDNSFRHSISLMSKHIFVTTEDYKLRAEEIVGGEAEVYNVGALSVDNYVNQDLFSIEEFKDQFDIDLNLPSILSTFHPETVSIERNKDYIQELINAFNILKNKYQIIITLPNSDTMGDMIREQLLAFAKTDDSICVVESFGMKGYLSCMKHSAMLLGNTSSGFVEAATFPKWVINIGDRQKGRLLTPNIITSEVRANKILEAVRHIEKTELPNNVNVYGNGNTAITIANILKEQYESK